MRYRAKLKVRLRSTILKKMCVTYPKPYLDLRFWWLHELRQLRAKRKYGSAKLKDIKVAQKELARLRQEYL